MFAFASQTVITSKSVCRFYENRHQSKTRALRGLMKIDMKQISFCVPQTILRLVHGQGFVRRPQTVVLNVYASHHQHINLRSAPLSGTDRLPCWEMSWWFNRSFAGLTWTYHSRCSIDKPLVCNNCHMPGRITDNRHLVAPFFSYYSSCWVVKTSWSKGNLFCIWHLTKLQSQ